MAFWGVEVKPGRPFVHTYASESGPLRLSQATLGIGTAIERSILQCNVGDKAPVLLCSLLPNRIESTCLELEFEEKGAVVFSVIGPRSVHLAGYFLRGSSRRGGGDGNESESFGEDIWDTGSNESGSFHSSEDKYESDFIDDGDVEISALPRRDSEAIVEEILEEKPANRKRTHRHLRKKQQIIESDDEGLVSHSQINNHEKSSFSESEEDGLPISFSISNRKKKADGNLKLNTVVLDTDKNSKPVAVMNEKGLEREDKVVAVSGGKSKKKSKDKIKSSESLETHNTIPDGNMQARGNVDQSNYADNTREQTKKVNLDNAHEVIQSESSGKTRKKKKEKVRQGETKAEVEPTVDKSEGTAAMEKMDNKKHEHPADESGDKVVYDDKDVLDSHDKLRRKKKKAKTKSDVEVENDEILQKDGTEIQTMDVATIEAPTSHKKRDKKSTARGPLPDMTLNVNEEAQFAVVPHEPNIRKQKKMKSM